MSCCHVMGAHPPSLLSPPLHHQNTTHHHPPIGCCHHDSFPIIRRHPQPTLRAGACRHEVHAVPFVHPCPHHCPHPVIVVHPSIPCLLVPSAPHNSHIAPLSPPHEQWFVAVVGGAVVMGCGGAAALVIFIFLPPVIHPMSSGSRGWGKCWCHSL
jgi:hypothetical protein